MAKIGQTGICIRSQRIDQPDPLRRRGIHGRQRSSRSGKIRIFRSSLSRQRWSSNFEERNLYGRPKKSGLFRTDLSGFHRRQRFDRRQEVRREQGEGHPLLETCLQKLRGFHGGRLQTRKERRTRLGLKKTKNTFNLNKANAFIKHEKFNIFYSFVCW